MMNHHRYLKYWELVLLVHYRCHYRHHSMLHLVVSHYLRCCWHRQQIQKNWKFHQRYYHYCHYCRLTMIHHYYQKLV